MDSTIPNDLNALLMPYSANRQFKAAPKFLSTAEGIFYGTPDGRQILDGMSGMWCVNAGHNRAPIVEAIRAQAGKLDYAPSYQISHPLAFELANRLAGLMPAELDHVFFCNSGSEAVDSALKIALAYHRAKGEAGRRRLIGRARGFHGTGFGGMSVGGIPANRRDFGSLLPETDHLPDTHDPARNLFAKGQPVHGAEYADALLDLIALHGADSIAAVIVEPMAGSTGVLVPPEGYLERLRTICTAHGILLIFDEVITAFGRLGAGSAAERFGVVPDMMTTAKGLTNAAVPMGAVVMSGEIYDGLMSGPEDQIEFFHGYTYAGHPLACAAGLAALDLYRDENLFDRAAGLETVWQEAVHRLRGAQHVVDIRNIGLAAAIELAPRAGAPGARAQEVFQRCFEGGALVRYTGDTIAMAPPLIIEENQIDSLTANLADAINRTA